MNKSNWISVILALIIVALGAYYFGFDHGWEGSVRNNEIKGPKDISYQIEGQNITLVNGNAEQEAAPGSASKIKTQYFGNEAYGDLNGDGTEDTVFLLTQDGGGTGTFYYVAVALKRNSEKDSWYEGTNAVLLGDRISPQITEIRGDMIIVNYAERKEGDPMTTQPTVGVSKYLRIKDGVLVEGYDNGVIFCTQEAKMCPDGSYVGRTGPNCEFAACP